MISTTSYLKRHGLLDVVGLATKDQPDDDGKGGAAVKLAVPRNPLLDEWNTKAMDAKTEAELSAVWQEGLVPINASKDRLVYDGFKATVATKRQVLRQEAQPGGEK